MTRQKCSALRRAMALFLALALALGCAGCGGANAATMFLRRTEGTVAVTDGEGGDVAPKEDLGLFSGYAVGTEAESFAWIDLDKVKLAKLDENSAIHIVKDGKNLSIDVNAGGLFFNVTEPLAEDETMEIRSSTMMVGIRGTCGWVDVPDAQHMNVYLLEGTVVCSAGENTVTVTAGQMAALAADGTIAVSEFDAAAVPGFVTEELSGDEALNEAVREASGLNIAAYSMASYEELLATIENVVFAELVDFEADGSPELLVVRQDDTTSPYQTGVFFTIYRSGPDGLQQLCGGSCAGASYMYLANCSLAERDGKTYVRCYTEARHDADGRIDGIHWYVTYYGSVAERDGAASDWGIVDEFDVEEYYDYGTIEAHISRHDEKGFVLFKEQKDEILENPDSYTVVRELCACLF